MDEIVRTGKGISEVKPSKTRHRQGLNKFDISHFEVRVSKADLVWLQDDISDIMLFRKEEATQY